MQEQRVRDTLREAVPASITVHNGIARCEPLGLNDALKECPGMFP
jgi:hypothetical protein